MKLSKVMCKSNSFFVMFFLTLFSFQVMPAYAVMTDSITTEGQFDNMESEWRPVTLFGKFDRIVGEGDSVLTIVTIPDDAAIYADSLLLGYSPLKMPLLDNITIRKKGFEPKIVNLNGKIGKQEILLQQLPSAGGELFFETNTFQLVSAAIILFGGTAAYLKIQADKNFDMYQATGVNSYLDKTKSYDIYSGIAFGVMQVNFGYLVYKFLVSP